MNSACWSNSSNHSSHLPAVRLRLKLCERKGHDDLNLQLNGNFTCLSGYGGLVSKCFVLNSSFTGCAGHTPPYVPQLGY